MAKFLFLQEIQFEFFGVMYLSAVIKRAGHDCDLLIWPQEKDIINSIKNINPDFIGIYATTGPHERILSLLRKLRSNSISTPIIVGGPHPTFFPEFLDNPEVDIIAIGESESSIVQLLNEPNKTDIPGLWFKKDAQIIKNPIAPPIQDLDSIPLADRSIYYNRYDFIKKIPIKRVITSRGCPWNCTFCYNRDFKKLYGASGKYLRKRSVESVLAEIKFLKESGAEVIRFSDDTFGFDQDWLSQFLKRYNSEVRLPFTCLMRASEITVDIAKILQPYCRCVFFGIESGNEYIRNTILNKCLPESDIISAANILHGSGIKFGTYNMFCLPGEDLLKAWETVDINVRIKTDYPYSGIYHPFEKTQLAGDKTEIKDKLKIINLNSWFYFVVKYPVIKPLAKLAICLPKNPIYSIIGRAGSLLSRKSYFDINIFKLIKIGWQLRGDI